MVSAFGRRRRFQYNSIRDVVNNAHLLGTCPGR